MVPLRGMLSGTNIYYQKTQLKGSTNFHFTMRPEIIRTNKFKTLSTNTQNTKLL